MKSNKALDIAILVLKILGIMAIACSLCLLAFFSYRLVQSYQTDFENAGDPSYHGGSAFYAFASMLVMIPTNVVALVLNSIGLLTSALYRGCPNRRKNLRFFNWCYLPPIAGQVLHIAFLLILAAIY